MSLFDEGRVQDLCARLLDKQNERGCSFDSKHGQRVRHSNDAEIKKPPDNNQAVFLSCRPLFQGFFQLLDLAFVLGNFLEASGDFLLDIFLAGFGHLCCSFCSGDTRGVCESVH